MKSNLVNMKRGRGVNIPSVGVREKITSEGEIGRRSRWKKEAVPFVIVQLIATLGGVFFLFPFLWMLLTSVKSLPEISKVPPTFWPETWDFSSYLRALTIIPFLLYLRNTLLVCFAVIVGKVISCALPAYGFARVRWPGRDLIFYVVLATMMLPYQVTMIPLFVIFTKLNWLNTYWPLVVPAYLGDAFFIFLLRQFFLTIPPELSDAARVDGARELEIFWWIILPLAVPGIATVALFSFMNSYTDFLTPLIYLNNDRLWTLSLGMQGYLSRNGADWSGLMAGAVLFTLPMIILFFASQRAFIQGITMGGLRG
jgi:multiple sugar transport system permease protein